MFRYRSSNPIRDETQLKLMEEACILVDNNDRNIGSTSKKECHLLSNIKQGYIDKFGFNGRVQMYMPGMLSLLQRHAASSVQCVFVQLFQWTPSSTTFKLQNHISWYHDPPSVSCCLANLAAWFCLQNSGRTPVAATRSISKEKQTRMTQWEWSWPLNESFNTNLEFTSRRWLQCRR